jgi:hypothetical protein
MRSWLLRAARIAGVPEPEVQLPLTGGCLCGGVRFRLSRPPLRAGYCHCTRCQRRTGTAASAQASIDPEWFELLAGEELLRDFEPPDGFAKVFCSNCGSGLWSRSPDDPARISIRLGAFDGDPGVRPQERQHVATAAVWEPIPDDGLPRYSGPRPG